LTIAKRAWIVAAVYLAAHLPYLAPSLEDIDSINFALGLRHFDPALHQPHPPGYPVYIALGHLSLPIVERLVTTGAAAAEAKALAVWSALGGAVCLVAAWFLFGAVAQRARTGGRGAAEQAVGWAVLLLAAAPDFWMTGLRPMSDMPGLALAIGAQALMLRFRLTSGALLAGIATGIRVQSAVLTLPVLALTAFEERRIVRPAAAFVIGCLAWGIPLVIASGGIHAYLAALHTQAAEDFSWVDMLWSNPTPRHIAIGLYQALVLPWASVRLAAAIGAAAVIGAVLTAWLEWRAFVVLCVGFAPYLVFHLLFQQLDTVRYALPIVVPVAWLAARSFVLAGRYTPMVAVPFIAGALAVAVPGGIAYAREPHPAFRAIADARQRARVQPPAAVFSHYAVRRPLQAAGGSLPITEPPTQYEWLGPVNYWRNGGTGPVWFFADQRRTDLALIDPHSRTDVVRYRWDVEQRPELSGTRPLGVDWYRLGVPGWFAGTGWSLTPEVGGLTQAAGAGPDHRPIEAWVLRRPGPFHFVVGAYHLGTGAAADADVSLSIDGRVVDSWVVRVADRNVLRFVDLPQGIAGAGPFAAVTIASRSLDPSRPAPVAIRQFDAQPAAEMIYGYGEGWHEAEFDLNTGRMWRWTSERSVLRTDGAGESVRLTMQGESPLRYFDRPPTVKVTAGPTTVAQFRPAADFEWSAVVPAAALAASKGTIAIETDRVYLPAQAEGTRDERHLGLRIFDLRLSPVSP
jgi:hypothetical protein